MLNTQIVRDRLGQYYKIQTSRDKTIPKGLKPELFRNQLQASSFLNNLIVPIGYLRKIYHVESLTKKHLPNESILNRAIAELITTGKVKVYKVSAPSINSQSTAKRTVLDKNKNRHTFAPSSVLLNSNPQEVLTFSDKKAAEKYLAEISPDEDSLQNIVHELGLPKTQTVNDSAVLKNQIATGLVSGEILVIVHRYTTSAKGASNSESDNANTGAIQSDKDASQGPEKPVCTFDMMTIQCSHFGKGRSYKLDVINDKPNLNGIDKALQVIAKPGDPDEITVSYSGSCANSSKECPLVKVSSDTLNGTFVENPYKFKALPLKDEREPGGFIDFLKYYLVPDLSGLKYQVYTIEKSGCNGNEGNIAKLYAFPTFKWGGSVEFGYVEKDPKKNKESSELKLAAKINGNVGVKKWSFETSKSNDTSKYFPDIHAKVDNLVKRIDKFKSMTDPDAKSAASADIGLVKLSVGWPNISLGGNIELKEASNDFDVDVGGDLSLSFSPLIKADLKTDILDWFVTAAGGPFGEFLRRVKIQAAKGIGTEKINARAILALDLVVNGSLSAELKWEKTAKEKWLSTAGKKSGSASLGLTIGLVGMIKGETQIFRVKITMGAEFHLKGARNSAEGIGGIVSIYATTDKDKPAIGGKFEFTGAALYYTYYAEVGSAEIESENTKTTKNGRQRSGLADQAAQSQSSETKYKEDKLEKFHEFFKPFEVPGNTYKDKPTPISDIGL